MDRRQYLQAAAVLQQEIWQSESTHGFMPSEARRGASHRQIEALLKTRYTLAEFQNILAGRLSRRTAGDLLTGTHKKGSRA